MTEYINCWDELFIRQAMLIALKSKDPSTKVGCVIVGQDNAVLSMGFNGFPRGVQEVKTEITFDETGFAICESSRLLDRWDRPAKYLWIEHAERNAIYNAARHGIKISGAKAYFNFDPITGICEGCARGLIQAGIVEIIGPNIPFKGKGSGANYHTSLTPIMCEEAGVLIRTVKWSSLSGKWKTLL